MDNFKIDVTCEGDEALRLALKIAVKQHRTVTHYADLGAGGLGLFWSEAPGTVKLPCELDADGAADLVLRWLKQQPEGRWQQWCDHDGSMGSGWRVYNEDWGRVGGHWAGVCAVQPVWAWYGK